MGWFDFWKKGKEVQPSEPLVNNSYSQEEIWDEAARESLKDEIRNRLLGEIRFNRYDQDAILDFCQMVHIEDQAPEDEQEDFSRFAQDELKKVMLVHSEEQQFWPAETDCERLDRVEKDLQSKGILLWQASPCCDTCSNAELPARLEVIEERHPGFRPTLRGYAFYNDQSLPEMLAVTTEVDIYLAYGWVSPEGVEVEQDEYSVKALSIANEIVQSLKDHGFDVKWNGELSQKVEFTLNWQRRNMLS
jgi:hypothetical protein